MPPGKLDASILLALGLAAGCGDKDTADTDNGPCLDYPTDTDVDTGPCLTQIEDTGPCLDIPSDTGDTGDTNPCLDYPVDTGDTGDDGQEGRQARPAIPVDRAVVQQRVLESGVLPDDVVKLLEKRRLK